MGVRVRYKSQIYRDGAHLVLTGEVSKVVQWGTKHPRWVVHLQEVRGLKGHRYKREDAVWVQDVLGLV